MGKKNLTIGEISEILNITPSTLRFWEKENLFHVSKKSNHYRTYTNTDLIDIADILYYRNLGVPVKDIRAFLLWNYLNMISFWKIRNGNSTKRLKNINRCC